MRLILRAFITIALVASPSLLLAQGRGEEPALLSGEPGSFLAPDEGPPAHKRHFNSPGWRRGRDGGLQVKKFRQELRVLGREIRQNHQVIRSLEEELETMSPGLDRAEVRKKLAEARRRQAELELTLARRRVEIARRARDLAQDRYDDARLELENVKRKIKKNYPDLKIFPEEKF